MITMMSLYSGIFRSSCGQGCTHVVISLSQHSISVLYHNVRIELLQDVSCLGKLLSNCLVLVLLLVLLCFCFMYGLGL
ncbi:hypothetical protein N665_1883s0007 [Sinapis alba]|nr:hypothetical protein N665_1883s0007 [Sinapis alba]